MASGSSRASSLVQLIAIFCFAALCLLQTCTGADQNISDINILKKCNIDKIYQFGGSKHDTGNGKIENPKGRCALPPYGQNFLKEPTGRCSNGLLMIDFIAAAAGLPMLSPSLAENASFSHGANFAVGGSTALPRKLGGGASGSTGSYLGAQVEWMSKLFVSECNPTHKAVCGPERHKHSLFIVGETGGNDYTDALFTPISVPDIKANVTPKIVGAIIDATKTVISQGAEQVIVPGQYPLGCFPVYLSAFKVTKPKYDEHGCIVDLNDLAKTHNHLLKEEITKLQATHPNIKIVYGDYYYAFTWLLNNGPQKGLDRNSLLKACCGKISEYNFEAGTHCGQTGLPVCPNPDQFINWDEIHLTQKANSLIAAWLVSNIVPQLHCNTTIN